MHMPHRRTAVTYIQEIQVVAPPKWQVYTGTPCGGQTDLPLNMHSQQNMNYTHRAARGDVASAAIPVSISATAAQWRSEQHTYIQEIQVVTPLTSIESPN